MKLFNWFRLGRLESDLDRELKHHIDCRISDLVESGLTEPEAKRQAAMELGGVTQVREEVRDIWLTRWLRDFIYDLHFSARSFRQSPSFTATVVLSLALGIGATTAIYSLVNQVILHALPVDHPERLVLIDWQGDQLTDGFGSYDLMSYPICLELQEKKQFFEGVLCRAATTVNFSAGGNAVPTAAEIVSGSYFSVLGVKPAQGRLITQDDNRAPGASPVVVLSWDFWKSQLGGVPDILGRKVLMNGYPMTVIGIAAPSFRGIDVGEIPTIWIPATMSGKAIPGFKSMLERTRWMQVLGKLRPDVSLEQARTGLQPWFKARLTEDARRVGFRKTTPEQMRGYLASWLSLTPAPQGHSVLHRRLTEPLRVLFAATGVLLCLACLNVAGLFLARGSARGREISTRLALGASRGRIGRQLLADSILLALAGGLLGILLAPVAMRTLIAFLPRETAANALESTLDSQLLLFAFLISVAAGLLSGFAPALQAGGKSLISSLRERGGTSLGGLHLRKLIVTAQIAFTLILVTGAALFTRSLNGLLTKGPGFDTTSLISFGIRPESGGYSTAAAAQLIQRVHNEIRTSPGTRHSAIARLRLLTGGSWNDPMTIQANRRMITNRDVNLNAITPGFFSTLGARIIAGRDFNEHDTLPLDAGGRRIAIINDAFAKRYFAGRSPLGTLIGEGAEPDTKADTEIVGVVTDVSYRGIREETEEAWFPITTDNFGTNFYVRYRGTPDAAFRSIREIVHKADPTLPIAYFRTLDEQVNRSLSTERMLATLSSSFGTLALLLSLVGLYGVMSFVVTQRTREIGIRLALGATRGTAVWLVLRDALIMIVAGTAIALPCVWAFGHLLESQLYNISARDPLTILAAALILCSAALCAALVPARRASSVNPVEALRFE